MGEGNPWLIDPTGFYIMMSRGQFGMSVASLQHFVQSARTGEVTYLDYGRNNLAVYGSDTPPRIPFENINVPVALFYGSEDRIADETDANWFREQLGDNIIFDQIYYMTHMSFPIGVDTSYLNDVIEIFENYPLDASS